MAGISFGNPQFRFGKRDGQNRFGLAPGTGGGVPAGYSRTTFAGINLTFNGRAVFDNRPNEPLSVRTK